MSECFALFESAIGTGGIAWTEQGVSYVVLPEPDAQRVRARLSRHFRGAIESPPPPEIEQAIGKMVALLLGEPVDLSGVRLDMGGVPSFERQVYDFARTVAPGNTVTYGWIAAQLGDARLAREVGQALAHNRFPIIVPCHRVIAANGRLGGFSARGGLATKQRLLEIERANVSWQLPLEV